MQITGLAAHHLDGADQTYTNVTPSLYTIICLAAVHAEVVAQVSPKCSSQPAVSTHPTGPGGPDVIISIMYARY